MTIALDVMAIAPELDSAITSIDWSLILAFVDRATIVTSDPKLATLARVLLAAHVATVIAGDVVTTEVIREVADRLRTDEPITSYGRIFRTLTEN